MSDLYHLRSKIDELEGKIEMRIALLFVVCFSAFLTPRVALLYLELSQATCTRRIPASSSSTSDECVLDACCVSSGSLHATCAFVPGLYHSTDFEVHRNWMSIVTERDFSWLRHDNYSNNNSSRGARAQPLTLVESLRYWYREDTSLWTLDYPPFFAWFELLLGSLLVEPSGVVAASVFHSCGTTARECSVAAQQSISLGFARRANRLNDPGADRLISTPLYMSRGIVVYQRLTVIIFSDSVFFMVCWFLWRTAEPSLAGANKSAKGRAPLYVFVTTVVANCALLLVDSIHFQYNGLIFAVMLLSARAAYRKKPFTAAAWYFALVMLKHMMAYYGLGYAAWGFATVVASGRRRPFATAVVRGAWCALRFLFVLGGVLVVAMGPFVLSEWYYLQYHNTAKAEDRHVVSDMAQAVGGALEPMRLRLFPFGRGLCHAYWAPNTWALYSAADVVACRFRHLHPSQSSRTHGDSWCGRSSVNTRGLVGLLPQAAQSQIVAEKVEELLPTHGMLPNVTPLVTHVSVVVLFLVTVAVSMLRAPLHSPLRSMEWWASGDGLMWGSFVSAYAFFLLSWHVHEKAFLTVSIPVLAAMLCNPALSITAHRWHTVLALVGIPVLFPLFFSWKENLIKYLAFATLVCLPGVSVLLRRGSKVFLSSMWLLIIATVGLVVSSLWVDITLQYSSFTPLMFLSCFGSVVVHCVLAAAVWNPWCSVHHEKHE